MSNEQNKKHAADALRLLPKLAKENRELKLKVAQYKRKERIEKIARELVSKKQIGEHEYGIKIADLSRLDDAALDRIEAGLSVISSSGSLSLGEVEQSDVGGASNEPGLNRLLLAGDPDNY